jgi:hypothetical protein
MSTESLPSPRKIHDYHLRPGDTFYRIAILL